MKRIAWRTGAVLTGALLATIIVSCSVALAQTAAPVIPTGLPWNAIGICATIFGLIQGVNFKLTSNIAKRLREETKESAATLRKDTSDAVERLRVETKAFEDRRHEDVRELYALREQETKTVNVELDKINRNLKTIVEAFASAINQERFHQHTVAMACARQHSEPAPPEPRLMDIPQLQ